MTDPASAPAILPTWYLSHGGGPWPWMETGDTYTRLAASLADIRHQLAGKVRAVLVVTAHWETESFTFSSGEQPGMIYDYGGFPPETYTISYPAPGLPALAARARDLLAAGGMPAALDPARGYDHGTFSLLKAIWPDATVPVVQMSIRRDYDPALHLAAGRLLAPLRAEGVAILGSGLSYHNLRAMGAAGAAPSRAFDDWLHQALVDASPLHREAMLLDWQAAPAARLVHPREDHLMPLHVAVGAAHDEPGATIYHQDDFFGTLTASSFRFGPLPK